MGREGRRGAEEGDWTGSEVKGREGQGREEMRRVENGKEGGNEGMGSHLKQRRIYA